MADGLTFKISGIADVAQRMRSLPAKVRTRGGKQAVRAGAEKIRDVARQNAAMLDDPVTPESIEANIVAQFASQSSRSGKIIMYRVGVMGGARRGRGGGGPGGDTFYWRFLEFGTSKMRAQPFMRPAMESQAEYAAEEIATVMEKVLDRAAKP